MSEYLSLVLPFPPSVNTYWRHPNSGPLAGRHLISEKGRMYRQLVLSCTNWQQRKKLSGRLSVTLVAFPPDKRRRDLDNLAKAVLDALTHANVIEDDGNIDMLTIARAGVRTNGEIVVRIEPATGLEGLS